MKALLLSLLFLNAPAIFAEGIASMTEVTEANGKALPHHGLAVICKPANGTTFVDLIFRPEKDCPFSACTITIHDEDRKKVLLRIDPEICSARKIEGLPDGSRVYFHIADEWVDRVEITYHLHANDFQSHYFKIKKGELQKLADLPQ